MKITIGTIIGGLTLAGMLVAGLFAFGFKMETPADVFDSHVGDFHEHVEAFDTFLARDRTKDAGRAARTQLIEAQTVLTCLRTGADTLAMLDLTEWCVELGVRR